MATEERPVVGTIKCPYCGSESLVKKDVKKRLYYFCPNHKTQNMSAPAGQDWILENMTALKPGQTPPALSVAASAPPAEDPPESPIGDDQDAPPPAPAAPALPVAAAAATKTRQAKKKPAAAPAPAEKKPLFDMGDW